MKVGLALMLQNLDADRPDADLVRGEVELAVLAEDLGFDFISFPEHHFGSYSFCVDNVQLLSYIAAKTSVMELLLGIVVLPWHDPLRVAEKILLLDALSEGRLQVGFGRGMARREYNGLRIPMEESRERFDEAARLVVDAIESGVAEGHGRFYPQPRVELRPRPTKSFRDRLTSVAMSPSSANAAAEIRARMMSFISMEFEDHTRLFNAYRDRYVELHGVQPPPPIFSDKTVCRASADEAEEVFMKPYVASFAVERRHYELDSDELQRGAVKGYESYQKAAQVMSTLSDEQAAAKRAKVLAHGTPDAILERIQRRVDVLGTDITCMFNPVFGGLPLDEARKTMEMLSKEVIPVLHEMTGTQAAVG